MLMREPASGPRNSRLDLVEDEENVVLIAPAAHSLQITLRRGYHSALANDRFQHDGGRS
jgi:hypothetical protein